MIKLKVNLKTVEENIVSELDKCEINLKKVVDSAGNITFPSGFSAMSSFTSAISLVTSASKRTSEYKSWTEKMHRYMDKQNSLIREDIEHISDVYVE